MQTVDQTTRPLRVVVVEDDDSVRAALAISLRETFGHQIVGEAANGQEMVEIVLKTDPDLVLFDIHLPHLNGLDALRLIAEQKRIAAVAITADRDQELVQRASEEHVLAFLVKPFEHYQLGPVVKVAWARFEEMRGLASENARLQQTLENRKLIERAKGALMKRHRWSEQEAFRRLQRAAMNQRTTMASLARRVLDGTTVEL